MLHRTIFAIVFFVTSLLAACSKGGEGEACFEDRHCRGSLVCCNATSTTRGTCEEDCEDVPGLDAGTGSDSGTSDAATDGGEDDPDGGEDDPDGGEDDPDGGEDDPDGGEDDPDGGEDSGV